MSERKRCQFIVYLGSLDRKDGRVTSAVRAICDRPVGHPTTVHKGRLAFGQAVFGIVEWTEAAP